MWQIKERKWRESGETLFHSTVNKTSVKLLWESESSSESLIPFVPHLGLGEILILKGKYERGTDVHMYKYRHLIKRQTAGPFLTHKAQRRIHRHEQFHLSDSLFPLRRGVWISERGASGWRQCFEERNWILVKKQLCTSCSRECHHEVPPNTHLCYFWSVAQYLSFLCRNV